MGPFISNKIKQPSRMNFRIPRKVFCTDDRNMRVHLQFMSISVQFKNLSPHMFSSYQQKVRRRETFFHGPQGLVPSPRNTFIKSRLTNESECN